MTWIIRAALVLAVVYVYAPVRSFPFIVFDDPAWLVENTLVNRGFSFEAAGRAFSESVLGNWVPLTWLSHMLDVEFFGLDAGAHHLTNALLHAVASLLLFEAFRRMTGDLLPSAFVALVFAIHPAHVESVAWITERRDVLAAVFWMLALLAWTAYARTERHGTRWLLLTALAFAAGLLAKPMLVTLPAVLLLLDLWPLRRGDEGAKRLLIEKLPFLAIAALGALATLASQGGAGAMASLEMVPVSARLANSLTSYVAYLGITAWPTGLAVFYPYDLEIPLWKSAGSALLLAALTAGALLGAARRPWLAVGWLWYLVTLAPVIGLLQVGSQGMADRYTYLPMIGLSVAVAWTGVEMARRSPRTRNLLLAGAIVWLGGNLLLARSQIQTWSGSVALFEHALRISGDHPIVLVNLGEAYEEAGDGDRAIAQYETALVDYTHAPRIRTRLAGLLAERGRFKEAAAQLNEALRRHPDEPRTRLELGRLFLRADQAAEAAGPLRDEHDRFPESPAAAFHLAEATAAAGERAEALALFAEAWRLDPSLPDDPLLDRDAAVADAIAQALAETGRAERALYWTRRGLTLARLNGALEIEARLSAALSERQAAARSAGGLD